MVETAAVVPPFTRVEPQAADSAGDVG
jgi:hypothetical protein